VCESDDTSLISKDEAMFLPVVGASQFRATYIQCANCGFEGSTDSKNDKSVETMLARVREQTAKTVFFELHSFGVSLAAFERAFGLASRTTNRWKTGEYSASSLALLRSVHRFPWLIKVADSGFDLNYSRATILSEAAKTLGVIASEIGSYVEFDVQITAGAGIPKFGPQIHDGIAVYDQSPFVLTAQGGSQ
jgi:hypothetical protein